MGRVLCFSLAVLAVAGCSSSGPSIPTIRAARIYELSGFTPTQITHPGPARLSFAIRQPSGKPLTAYKTGAGPHTGVHLIVVRDDLSRIIHMHPPIGADGKVAQPVAFPAPGPWKVLVDAYPKSSTTPNFQLFDKVDVAGAYKPRKLPAFKSTQTVDGYTFTIHNKPKLKAIDPAFLSVTITDPQGRPAKSTPWFGALAHAIFFRAGSLDYFHTHVCGANTPGCATTGVGAKIV